MAIEIARIVHRESEGQAVFERSEPLSVVEDGDAWVWLTPLTQVYLLKA
jgi:hypothetical protein